MFLHGPDQIFRGVIEIAQPGPFNYQGLHDDWDTAADNKMGSDERLIRHCATLRSIAVVPAEE
jgi:hypothetical protein